MQWTSILRGCLACVAAAELTCFLSQGAHAASPGVYPIDGIDESLGFSDLQPFKDLVGSAEIVGLGESVHASGGYYQAKFRLIRYMVEMLGFRAVALETNWGDTSRAEDYIRSCSGSSRDAVLPFFPVWQDSSVVKLLEYVCAYNQENPEDPVFFYGVDTQDPWENRAALERFIADSHSPGLGQQLLAGFRECLGLKYKTSRDWWASGDAQPYFTGEKRITRQEFGRCNRAITRFEKALETFYRDEDATRKRWAKIALNSLTGWEGQMYHHGTQEMHVPRDKAMAFALRELREIKSPGAKVIVWAHNLHVARNMEHNPNWRAKMMGSHLNEVFGDKYRPISLTGYRIDTKWPHQEIPSPPVPTHPRSVERLLDGQGYAHALVDLSQSFLQPGATYMMQHHTEPHFELVPQAHYDGIFFLAAPHAMNYVGL